jgi:L,D-transpeptidase catalytic domain
MPRPKFLLFLLLPALSLAWFFSSVYWKKTKSNLTGSVHKEYNTVNFFKEKTSLKANEAKAFVEKNNYNQSVCFLVDMSLPSGQNRFFVYDLAADSVQSSGLVAHGSCNQFWLEGRKYGNAVGCGCTSLGKYKIGNPYNGRFGLAFKLFGLENTNNKAFARFVVLHSHDCVPEMEVKNDICQSNGCPMVSPGFLKRLQRIINESKKPLLLWIYE